MNTALLWRLGCALAAFVGAYVCFAGYAMNASLLVDSTAQTYGRYSAYWAAAGIVFLCAGVALSVAAWKRKR